MRNIELRSLERKLASFIGEFFDLWGRTDRCLRCGQYVCGLLLDGERKSIEPMASRLSGGNMQALQQFVTDSPWEAEALQLRLISSMNKKLKLEAKDSVLILDDTSLPKQGKCSVGVNRQYCGALGKIANCQVLVSWQYAEGNARQLHFPLMAELFLPKVWIDDANRMERARVPERRLEFREKWKIALDLLEQITKEIPHEACVFDAGYGEIRPFLKALDERGEKFVAQIPPGPAGFWPVDVPVITNNPPGRPGRRRIYPGVADPTIQLLTAEQWGNRLLRHKQLWQTIRLPLRRRTKVKVAAIRVRERLHDDKDRGVGPKRWLIFERYQDGTTKYYVSNFPTETSIRKLIGFAHSRYKVEQGYQQLKEELGMDHYEGRSWQGLHHHVSLCFFAYDFLVLLQNEDHKKNSEDEHPIPNLLARSAA